MSWDLVPICPSVTLLLLLCSLSSSEHSGGIVVFPVSFLMAGMHKSCLQLGKSMVPIGCGCCPRPSLLGLKQGPDISS